MRVLLVTGAAGFIGANFVRYWTDTYPQDRVIVLDAGRIVADGPKEQVLDALRQGQIRVSKP